MDFRVHKFTKPVSSEKYFICTWSNTFFIYESLIVHMYGIHIVPLIQKLTVIFEKLYIKDILPHETQKHHFKILFDRLHFSNYHLFPEKGYQIDENNIRDIHKYLV